jgi:hypothetical protein
MEDLLADLYRPHIESVARKVAKRVYHMDQIDLEQELWVWFYSGGKESLEKGVTANPDLRPASILYKAANRIAQKELADYREFQGDFCYQPSDIRRVLKHMSDGKVTDAEARLDIEGALNVLADKAPVYHHAIMCQYFLDDEPMTSTRRSAASRGVDMVAQIVNENTAPQRQRVDIETLTDETEIL